MIEVIRTKHPERNLKSIGRVIPAFYECRYFSNGTEIATYNSQEDCIRLNSRIINDGVPKTEWLDKAYNRALKCKRCDDYKELFWMLNADETSRMSVYVNL